MSVNVILLSILQTLWLYSLFCKGRNVHIFGITPSKGLVGVRIDSECNGKVSMITSPVEGHTILRDCKLVSYDSSSNVALIERDSGVIQRTALCQNGLYYHKSLLNASSLVYLHDPNGWVCYNGRVTTFALYKSRLYFLVVCEFEENGNDAVDKRKVTKVELRMMQECSECGAPNISDFETLGVFRSPFLFNCSKRIAEVYNSMLQGDEDVRIKTTHMLKIVHNNGYLSFFFQVFIRRGNKDSQFIDLNLYHATEKGTVELIHEEKITNHYGRWKINGVGGLDYRDGVLCWSAGDRIFCGRFKDQALFESRMVLFPGDSVTTDVCKGNRPNLLPIVTGVSIIDVHEQEISLVFGCYAQWMGLGGAGLIKISPDMRTNKRVYPLYIDYHSNRLQLGSLFSTQYIAHYCEPKRDLPMCAHPSDPQTIAIQEQDRDSIYRRFRGLVPKSSKGGHYSRETQYTIVKAGNDTEIGLLDYSDLYNDSFIVSEHDRELFHEKGIGGASTLSCPAFIFYSAVSLVHVLVTTNLWSYYICG